MCSDVDQCLAQTILIDLDVAAGDTAEAAAAARELVAHQPALWKETEDGQGLRIVATALMSAGALDEAEPLYREALSRLRRYYGSIALVSYEVAMFLALSRRLDDAARLLAYADRVYTGEPLSARLVARQTRDRLLGFLAEQLAPDALSRLHDEGRRLSDADAGNLATGALATLA
jgi:hypothetical protein